MTAIVLTAAYGAIALLCLTILASRWNADETGLNSVHLAALWPLVALLLPVYFAAASAYTLVVVLRGRRAESARAGAGMTRPSGIPHREAPPR